MGAVGPMSPIPNPNLNMTWRRNAYDC